MVTIYFPHINDTLDFDDSTLSRYEPGMFDLLQGLLMKHPAMRWSVSEALRCKWLGGPGVGLDEPATQKTKTLSIRDSMIDSDVENAMSPIALRAMVRFASFREHKKAKSGLSKQLKKNSAYVVEGGAEGEEEEEEEEKMMIDANGI